MDPSSDYNQLEDRFKQLEQSLAQIRVKPQESHIPPKKRPESSPIHCSPNPPPKNIPHNDPGNQQNPPIISPSNSMPGMFPNFKQFLPQSQIPPDNLKAMLLQQAEYFESMAQQMKQGSQQEAPIFQNPEVNQLRQQLYKAQQQETYYKATLQQAYAQIRELQNQLQTERYQHMQGIQEANQELQFFKQYIGNLKEQNDYLTQEKENLQQALNIKQGNSDIGDQARIEDQYREVDSLKHTLAELEDEN